MFYASLFLLLCGGVALYFLSKALHAPALIAYLLWGLLLGYLGWLDPGSWRSPPK